MARPSKAGRARQKLEAVAYHEAGHAVIAFEYRRAVRRVSIVPDPDARSLGHVLYPKRYRSSFRPDIYDLDDARFQTACIREILISLAGPAAEEKFTGRRSVGAGDDMDHVRDLAWRVGGEEEGGLFLGWLTARARRMVAHPINWIRIEGLAKALLVTPTMGAKEAKEACRLASIASLPPIHESPLFSTNTS